VEEILLSLVTVYGPLGLGWLVALYLFWRSEKEKDRLIKLVKNNTTAVNEMNNAITMLTYWVKGHDARE